MGGTGSGTLKGAAWPARAGSIEPPKRQPSSAAEPPSAPSLRRSRRFSNSLSSSQDHVPLVGVPGDVRAWPLSAHTKHPVRDGYGARAVMKPDEPHVLCDVPRDSAED